MSEFTFDEIFNCRTCEHWYPCDEEGPGGQCQRCFANVPINTKLIVPEDTVALMRFKELEELATVVHRLHVA
jgi:hypothetical protein